MNIKTKHHIFILFLIHLPILLWCQTEKENPKNEIKWNQYKNEIALDCKFLNKDLNLTSIGTNLIYKKRFGEKKFISVTDKKSWRFQIGGYADYPLSSKDTFNFFGQYPRFINNQKILSIALIAGIEWQKQMGRFQLYYGLDTGLSLNIANNPIDRLYYMDTTVFQAEGTESLKAGIPFIGFMGLKYFFHPRFSVAIESSVTLGVFYSKFTTIIHDQTLTEIARYENKNSTNIIFDTNYLRFINVAFHL